MTTDSPAARAARAARVARILARVQAIPEGFVRTYGDINPNAPRLVGHVLATAPEDVPWHRVVRADGTPPMGRSQLERLWQEGVPMRGDRIDRQLARLPEAASSSSMNPVDDAKVTVAKWRTR